MTFVLSMEQSVNSSVAGFKYSDALNEIEGIRIEVIEPRLNKQSGKLTGATEYFQYVEDEVTKGSILRLEILAGITPTKF